MVAACGGKLEVTNQCYCTNVSIFGPCHCQRGPFEHKEGDRSDALIAQNAKAHLPALSNLRRTESLMMAHPPLKVTLDF